MPHTQTFHTSAAVLRIAATARGVTAVAIGDGADDANHSDASHALSTDPRVDPPGEHDAAPPLERWAAEIERRLLGLAPSVDVPLDLTGTPFQRRVWAQLLTIPRGARRTYQDIAVQLGQPTAARAVAGACAANRLALLIPCHRVVRGDGGLGGYRWGIAHKQRLLDAESETR
jgi:AraC family transcriptional regulator of adaptative response/methylated-DNA-[protein]-cysteine methyltransferase